MPAFSRLLPIAPRATPTNLHNLTLSVEGACVAPAQAASPQFLFERQVKAITTKHDASMATITRRKKRGGGAMDEAAVRNR